MEYIKSVWKENKNKRLARQETIEELKKVAVLSIFTLAIIAAWVWSLPVGK